MFAFGCLLWEIINREVPYDGLDSADIAAKVVAGDQLREHNLNQIDVRLAGLVSACRDVDQTQRPDFSTIVEILNEVLSSL